MEGKGVPKYVRNERLYPLVRELIWKNFKIRVDPLDVDKAERMNYHRSSPILIK